MFTINFQGYECKVRRNWYLNGNTYLELFTEDGPYAIATTNLGKELPEDQAYIKNYSENIGMLEALQDAGIVTEVIGWVPSGFVLIPLCQLDLGKLEEVVSNE